MQYKRFTRPAIFVLLCLVYGASNVAGAQPAQSPLPPPTGYVNDYAGIIEPATKAQMETILTNLKQRADIEFAVATVRTTGDATIFDYSLAVARGWGIGASEGEKNGLLLLVAVDDRKYQIQVSRHLEGDLPDGLVGELGRRMRDQFRQNRYNDGMMLAVQTFVATMAEKRGFSIEGIDQNQAYRAQRARETGGTSSGRGLRGNRGGFSIGTCCIIGVVILFLLMMSKGGGRRGGGGGSGCLNALLLGNLLSGLGGGRSSSGWGGGGSSGWGGGGGGGGGFGGFGGGGDFGGGGSGGSW